MSQLVTQEWCREVGFVRRFNGPLTENAIGTWFHECFNSDVVLAFDDTGCGLYLEDHWPRESVHTLLTNDPTVAEVLSVIDLANRTDGRQSQPETSSP